MNALTANMREPSYTLYNQYKRSNAMSSFFEALRDEVRESYINFIDEFLANIDVSSSTTEFFPFYTLNYLGVARPVGNSVSGEESFKWDGNTGTEVDNYDGSTTWDTKNPDSALIHSFNFIKYLRFIYDYRYETWTIDYVLKLLIDWGVPIANIKVDSSEPSKPLNVKIIRDAISADIVSVIQNYQKVMSFMPESSIVFTFVNSLDKPTEPEPTEPI